MLTKNLNIILMDFMISNKQVCRIFWINVFHARQRGNLEIMWPKLIT